MLASTSPLLTGERVILGAHKSVEREWWELKLVRMSELALRLDECGTLSMETRFLLNRRVPRNERCGGNSDGGGFTGEETADVHGLRDLYGGKYRSTSNQRKHDLWPQGKAK